MFTLLLGLLACGEKEATTNTDDVATTEEVQTTEADSNTTTEVPTAVYPETKEVTQVAPDESEGTTSVVNLVGSDDNTDTTNTTTTTETNGDAQ
jgi:hypothetical protein